MEAKLRYRKELSSSHFAKPKIGKLSPRKYKPNVVKESVDQEIKSESPRQGTPRIDFIQRNIEIAATSKSRQLKPLPKSRKQCVVDATHELGAIPDYITDRKIAIEIERSIPDEARCPPGKRLMTEEEKTSAIQSLLLQKRHIEEAFSHEPLQIDTLIQLKRHESMDQRLRDIETAIDYLKHKYVFVSE